MVPDGAGHVDDQDLYRAEAEVAAGAHRTALDIYEAATDDLDRAEAHEAVEQALGEYRFVASVYGRVRWRSAGLIVGDESSLQAGDWEDATLQVARERAVEAFRAGAAADTLAAIDLAYEATETAAHLSAAALSDVDESDQPVEAPDSGASLFEASEGWLVATEALQDAVEAAEEAEDARKAASAAVKAARAAVGDAEGSAIAIYEAAHADGNWVAMITDVEVHMTTARSAAEDAGDFSEQAFEAQVAAQVAAEAARAAAQDSATARALAEQIGATKGKQAYWDMPIRARWARIDAEREASRAARIAGSPTRTAADAAQAIEEAAWHAARIVAAVDVQAVSAFRQSLQESCR